jgi:hypothetical protein
MNPRPQNQFLVAIIAGSMALLLSGCEVPELDAILSFPTPTPIPNQLPPPATGNPGNQIQIELEGVLFGPSDRLLIDGFVDGFTDGETTHTVPYQVSVAQLTFDPSHPTRHLATLNIAADAHLGGYAIAVGAPAAGISQPQPFYVVCPGCPLPPSILSFAVPVDRDDDDRTFVLRGQSYRATIIGDNLAPNPVTTFSPAGVNVTGPANSVSDLSFAVPISVDADAPTGLREVRVTVNGQTSLPTVLRVIAAPPNLPVIRSTDIDCLHVGLNDISVTGDNFDVGASVDLYRQKPGPVPREFIRHAERSSPGTDPQHQLDATIRVDPADLAELDLALRVTTVDGKSNFFDLLCFLAQVDLGFVSIQPSAVARNSRVYVKLDGHRFLGFDGPGNPHTPSIQVSGNGITNFNPSVPFYGEPTVHADGDSVLVAELDVGPDADPEIQLEISVGKNSGLSRTLTNSQRFFTFDQLPDAPTIRNIRVVNPTISTRTPNTVPIGGDADLIVNVQNVPDVQEWLFDDPTVHGIHFSGTTAIPAISSFMVHVHADPDASITGDVATNLLIQTPTNDFTNPFAVRIQPP